MIIYLDHDTIYRPWRGAARSRRRSCLRGGPCGPRRPSPTACPMRAGMGVPGLGMTASARAFQRRAVRAYAHVHELCGHGLRSSGLYGKLSLRRSFLSAGASVLARIGRAVGDGRRRHKARGYGETSLSAGARSLRVQSIRVCACVVPVYKVMACRVTACMVMADAVMA